MKIIPLLATILFLLSVAISQPVNSGTTLQATTWPTIANSWAGRFSCNGCNPTSGDVPCSASLPLLCISKAKSSVRPMYKVAIEYTPFAVTDGGYYDGWTGGVFEVTEAVQGSQITSQQAGDTICQNYFGPNAKFASFNDGYYMDYMNSEPDKAWSTWDWSQAKQGGWNMWGYFNHHYRGRAWVNVNSATSTHGNCWN